MKDTGIKFTMVCPGFVKTNLTYAALTGDGSPLNKMGDGTKNGLLPDVFAKKMVNAIYQQKSEVYIGGFKEVLAVYLKRFAPGILENIIAKANVT
jgi:short-subunit dehydrogenase